MPKWIKAILKMLTAIPILKKRAIPPPSILLPEEKFLEEVRQNNSFFKKKLNYPLIFLDSFLEIFRNRKYEITSKSGTKIECKVIINSI